MKNSCVHTRTRIFLSEICVASGICVASYICGASYIRLRRVIFAGQVIMASYICGASGKTKSRHSPKKLVKNTCPYRPRGDIGNERQVVRQSQGIALLPFCLIKNNTDNTDFFKKYLTRCVCYVILHINSTDSTQT